MTHPDPAFLTHGLTAGRPALLDGGSDGAFRGMLHDLISLSSGLEQLRDRFGAFMGLSGPQYAILSAIRQVQGERGVGVKELADHLGLSAAFVTIETKRLAKLGVIHKRGNPDDQRRVHLTLSPRGVELLLALAPLQRQVNDRLFGALSAAEFRSLCDLLHRLRPAIPEAITLAEDLLDDGKDEK